jgi:hypothetical protein
VDDPFATRRKGAQRRETSPVPASVHRQVFKPVEDTKKPPDFLEKRRFAPAN